MDFNVEGFQFCCGASEIGNLHNLTTASLRSFLNEQRAELADARNNNDSMFMEQDYPGTFIATTIPAQKRAARALRLNKFKKVFAFTNPGTGSKVTLWALKFVK